MRSWFRVGSTGLILAAMAALALASPVPAKTGLSEALAWLRGQQQSDGGFSNGFAAGSDPSTTADAVFAAAVAGEAAATWRPGGVSPLDYLESHAAEFASTDPGKASKLVLALAAAGQDPRTFAGTDWIGVLSNNWDAGTRRYAGDVYSDALAILALHAAGAIPAPQAAEGLTAARLPDGSYAFNGDLTPGGGDSNTTSVVVQALAALGQPQAEIQPSLGYFLSTQNPDGGWTYQKPSPYGEETDANSTALVIQALIASGENLDAWSDPQDTLLGLQQESGALAFNASTPGDNLLATTQAIPALAGVALSRLPAPSQRSLDVGTHLPLVVVVLEILALLLVGGAIAYRQSKRE